MFVRQTALVGLLGIIVLITIDEAGAGCYAEIDCHRPEGTDPEGFWSPPDDKCVRCHCEVEKHEIVSMLLKAILPTTYEFVLQSNALLRLVW